MRYKSSRDVKALSWLDLNPLSPDSSKFKFRGILLSVPFSYLQPRRCHPELGQARYSNFTRGIQWRGSKRRENESSRPFHQTIAQDIVFGKSPTTWSSIGLMSLIYAFPRLKYSFFSSAASPSTIKSKQSSLNQQLILIDPNLFFSEYSSPPCLPPSRTLFPPLQMVFRTPLLQAKLLTTLELCLRGSIAVFLSLGECWIKGSFTPQRIRYTYTG